MRKFKKISSFLSLLLVFSISVGTFPLSALAQYYTEDDGSYSYTYNGEIQVPNSSVLSGLGAFGASAEGELPFNANFQTAPSFSAGANNNWNTSLSSKTFSIVAIGNVGDYCDITLFSNSSLGINVYRYEEDGGRTISSCSPVVSVSTTQNVNGSVSGNPVAIQTSEVLPLAVFEEDTLVTRVESIQNDPNNVRVIVGVDSTIESYGARFQRIDGISNWIGHVANTDDGGFYLGGMQRANDAQLPQGVKIGASSPSVSRSVERLRNSEIIDPSVTQPKCTQWSDGNFWREVQHVHCVKYALSADGRTGEAHYYDSQSSGTFLQALITIGVGFAIGYFIGPGLIEALSSVTSIAGETLAVGANILSGASSIATLTGVVSANVAAASGVSTLGTVESTIASSPPYGTEKAWVWTWSDLPAMPATAIVPTITQDKDNTLPSESFDLTWGSTPVDNTSSCTVTYTGPSSGTISNEKSGSVSVPIPPNTLAAGEYTVVNTCTDIAGHEPVSATLNHTVSLVQVCPAGTTGTPPKCVTSTCPAGTTPPNCTALVPGTTSVSRSVIVTICPSNTPFWNGRSCVSTQPVDTPVDIVCPSSAPFWNGRICVSTQPVSPVIDTTGDSGNSGNNNNNNNNNNGNGNGNGNGNVNALPSADISASDTRVNPTIPDNTSITWTSNGATSCTVTKESAPFDSRLNSPLGGVTQSVTSKTTYAIDCRNAVGTATDFVTVNIPITFTEF